MARTKMNMKIAESGEITVNLRNEVVASDTSLRYVCLLTDGLEVGRVYFLFHGTGGIHRAYLGDGCFSATPEEIRSIRKWNAGSCHGFNDSIIDDPQGSCLD